jgi:RNA polymerase sporulation-specific sigma factor
MRMNRNIEERNRLVEYNMGLVNDAICHYVEGRSMRGLLTYEDLNQIGLMGLMAAADNFDENKGIEFSTYAETVIRNHIYNAFLKEKRFYNSNLRFENELTSTYYSEDFGETEEAVKQTFSEIKSNTKSSISKGIEALELVIDGYSYAEIAEKLDTTPENIKVLIHRARKELKEKQSKFSFLLEGRNALASI